MVDTGMSLNNALSPSQEGVAKQVVKVYHLTNRLLEMLGGMVIIDDLFK